MSCAHAPVGASSSRTIVFVARTIRTLNAAQPTAQALAVRDGKVLAVGSRREVLAKAGADAIVEEFASATIVPGLIDAHGHLEGLGRSLNTVSLEPAHDEAEAAALTAEWARVHGLKQGEWLRGRGWDQNDWPSRAYPTRQTLDALLPSNPVMLSRVDGHAAWVNSAALKLAGLTRETPDPSGGRLLRDARGELTGVLIDNAVDLVMAHLPPPSATQRQKDLKAALEACARVGLTQVHDAGMSLETFRLLQQWDMLGALPIRVYAMADGQGSEAEDFLGLGRFTGRHLELRAVKLLLDGALGSRGAALAAPYSDEPAQSGLMLLSPEVFATRAAKFAGAGFQVAVHAIGDRANHLALDVLGSLAAKYPDSRPRVEHAQVLLADDVARFGSQHVIASFQPTHATSDLPWAGARLGEARLKFAYAWRSVLEAHGAVALGSDFPVEAPNPLWGLYAARTRQTREGTPDPGWSPEQRLSGDEALRGFTKGGAFASFAETHRGELAVDFDADFTVLSVDPVADDARALLSAEVLLTVVGGVDVFRARP